jgi:hypothetical protein
VQYASASETHTHTCLQSPTHPPSWATATATAIYLKQEVPVLDTFYYFDVNNNNYQLGNFLNVNAGPQFINATMIYNGKWTEGPQAAELFDISDYDCSSMCSSNVAANVLNAGFFHKKH